MPATPTLPPCTVDDWDDARRRQRLRATRTGQNWVRFGRLRRTLVRLALALVPLVALYTQYWEWDVAPMRAQLAETRPVIHDVYDSATAANRDVAVVDLVGLGNLDATPTAAALPALRDIGRVWAVEYDNSGLDTAVVSRLVAERAAFENVDAVVLVGHSMGGIIALEVARHLYRDTPLEVLGVILDCTPVDLHAVRPDSRDAGEELLRWIGWLPGARESRILRTVVEIAARQDRFVVPSPRTYRRIDTDAFTDVVEEVLRDKILTTDAASNGLIESQFRAIVASGAIDDLQTLAAEHDDKLRPAVVFIRPRNAFADPVVDVDYTQRVLIDQSGGVGGTLLVAKLTGIGHANPIQAPEAYNTAIDRRIVPFLDLRPGENTDDTGSDDTGSDDTDEGGVGEPTPASGGG